MNETDVGASRHRTTVALIVGGGPVGLTLAIDLAQRGVDCILVDKRPAPGMLPKMERCNARTMENYRRLGLAQAIRAAGLDNDIEMDVFICLENLVNTPLVHHEYPSVSELKRESHRTNDGTFPAEPYQLISQYTLEPLLRRHAEASPRITVLFGHELVDFTQSDDQVRATVRADGHDVTIDACYLVGCDGASSTVRNHLGIQLRGDSLLTMRQALFRSPDLFDRIPIGRGRHYHIADNHNSFLIVQDDTEHFSLHATVDEDDDMPTLFERIVGFPIEYETLYVGQWTQRLMVADRYQDRRVLLAGDAVHLVIPTGGLGMNTGVGDTIDLAWKLAATVNGWAGDHLLDSYEVERRPIGLRNVEASRRAATGRATWRSMWCPWLADSTPEGAHARAELARVADAEQRWSNDLLGIELGYRYVDSPLIAAEEGEGPDPNSFQYQPTTWPGARLPHLWLDEDTAVQDVMGPDFSVVRIGREAPDLTPLGQALERAGIPFRAVDLNSDVVGDVYGCKALLVRPDLHIAWRGSEPPDDPEGLAARVVGAVQDFNKRLASGRSA